jgi:flagellar L-ring protein precursor FlgH
MKRPHVNLALAALLVIGSSCFATASKQESHEHRLAKYITRMQSETLAPAATPGGIWIDSGRRASLATDYTAAAVGDLITLTVVQDLTSTNSGAVSTGRSYSASSGVDSLPGKLKVGGAANLLGLHSAETLAGKGQASSSSTLTTTLAGRVAAVLGNGNLVIEAERVINMNHEKQTILLRGLVRRGDIGPNNTVASNTIGDLELEIKGKGVISEGVRPPHPVLRAIMRILNF